MRAPVAGSTRAAPVEGEAAALAVERDVARLPGCPRRRGERRRNSGQRRARRSATRRPSITRGRRGRRRQVDVEIAPGDVECAQGAARARRARRPARRPRAPAEIARSALPARGVRTSGERSSRSSAAICNVPSASPAASSVRGPADRTAPTELRASRRSTIQSVPPAQARASREGLVADHSGET